MDDHQIIFEETKLCDPSDIGSSREIKFSVELSRQATDLPLQHTRGKKTPQFLWIHITRSL